MNKKIHIVSFDIPYPPDYGGVIDVFYKIKALHEAGVEIYLHCFKYGRSENSTIEQYCSKVFYYKRRQGLNFFIKRKPYTVATRKSKTLLNNLLLNDWPILFEGLHTTFYITDSKLKNRKKIVRMHNIEHEYYAHLSENELSPFRRFYFTSEARKLKRYEKCLQNADAILAISPSDFKELSQRYANCHYIPVFHQNKKVKISQGFGKYIVYHGNLSVGENVKAVNFLIDKVFSHIKHNVVITGKQPNELIYEQASKVKNVKIVANPRKEELKELIKNAHIHILITFQATGIKLKLVNSLFRGRFCIVNNLMIANTGLEKLCDIADTPDEMIATIEKLFIKAFNSDLINEREKLLDEQFSNEKTVLNLINII